MSDRGDEAFSDVTVPASPEGLGESVIEPTLAPVAPAPTRVPPSRTVEDLHDGERGWVDVSAVVRDPGDPYLIRRHAAVRGYWRGLGSVGALVDRRDGELVVTMPRSATTSPSRPRFAYHGRPDNRYLTVGRMYRFRPLHLGREAL